MSDIIKLLPDSIASQIAAGEVIQRPASVIKELLENSVDAGSDEIVIVVKDSGKTLIQISDNGAGMSNTDARMSFERHATSKIKSIEDIFRIKTKGFRGEALASIASIAHVEMITRSQDFELGTRILIDGSVVKKQESVQSEMGTKIVVRNLFFNVPARRKFLKTDAVEWRHIMDEFYRIAMAHCDIAFSLYHNGNIVYHLNKTNLKQRIISLTNKGLDSKILPIDEDMELFKVRGYVGNLELLQKSKLNQYLFVNDRFIKSNYLNHAITSAYSEFNMFGENPFYVLFIDINPSLIDVNVHPTKQEIKFEEEKLVYNYLKVGIKHVLGKNIFVPKIEFDENLTFRKLQQKNGFQSEKSINIDSKINKPSASENQAWAKVYEIVKSKKDSFENTPGENLPGSIDFTERKGDIQAQSPGISRSEILQVFKNFLIYREGESLFVINISAAIERVNYDRILGSVKNDIKHNSKQLIFPLTLKLDESESVLNDEFVSQLKSCGIDCERVVNKLIVKSVPEYVDVDDIKELIENSLNEFLDDIDFRYAFMEKFALKACSRKGRQIHDLDEYERNFILKNLFNSSNHLISPRGEKILFEIQEREFLNILNS